MLVGRLEGMVGERIRKIVVGMKDSVTDIGEIVGVDVLDCESWELRMQVHITYLMSSTGIMNLRIRVLNRVFCST